MPALHSPSRKRCGFTLIELLIVIVIMSILATLVAIYVVPSFQDNKNVVRGVDRLITILLTAKQRALRDQAPRGIRFVVAPTTTYPFTGTTATNSVTASQVQYIEQPTPYRVGLSQVTVVGPKTNPPPKPTTPGSTTVTFSQPAGQANAVDFTGGAITTAAQEDYSEFQVQPGDYFRYENGTTANFRIVPPITKNTLTLATPFSLPSATTAMYQIVRQPRPISGEPLIDLPQNVVVDLTTVYFQSPTNQLTPRQASIPATAFGRQNVGAKTWTYFEIMFDPAGGVMNQSGGSTPIALFVRDGTVNSTVPTTAIDPNIGRVIAVYPRTGLVGAQPIAPGATFGGSGLNPFIYIQDGASSGL